MLMRLCALSLLTVRIGRQREGSSKPSRARFVDNEADSSSSEFSSTISSAEERAMKTLPSVCTLADTNLTDSLPSASMLMASPTAESLKPCNVSINAELAHDPRHQETHRFKCKPAIHVTRRQLIR